MKNVEIVKWLQSLKEEIGKQNNQHLWNYEEVLDMAIKALQDEWIPVSERLPNYREAVLISTFWGVRMAERDAIKEDGTDDFWYLFLDDATAHPRSVYAWMPLPEPYKGETDGKM